jgi:diguanylate cyclase (GGDEF)-like protein
MAPNDDLFKKVLDDIPDGVYLVDRERAITYWNKGAEAITGFRNQQVVGNWCGNGLLVHVDAAGRPLCGDGCPLSATIEDGQPREIEAFLHHERGHRVSVRIRANPIRDEAGEIIGAVEIFDENRDRVADRERLAELERMALLDPLTQLGNRAYAEMQLNASLAEHDRYGTPFGLLFFDVDQFKRVNDQSGHPAGDQVLRMVARTAANSLRPFDVLSRWGGDEFVAVIARVDPLQLTRVAEKVRALIAVSRLDLPDKRLEVTVSIGAAVGRANDTPSTLVARADRLMYASKQAGGDRVTLETSADSP